MEGSERSQPQLLTPEEMPSVIVESPAAMGPVVVVCEHAARALPEALGDLGLSPQARDSHIAWDPGALAVARRISRAFDAPLIAARYSRLAYDCNRPPDSAGAIAPRSEVFDVPGNVALDEDARRVRVDEFYLPFRKAVAEMLDARCSLGRGPALVTVHSFTPVYFGKPRAVEIGLLHDADGRLVDAMLQAAPKFSPHRVERNAPYGQEDGVTHTLAVDAIPRGIANVMIEIRNDLIADEAGQALLAAELTAMLRAGLATLNPSVAAPAPLASFDRQEG